MYDYFISLGTGMVVGFCSKRAYLYTIESNTIELYTIYTCILNGTSNGGIWPGRVSQRDQYRWLDQRSQLPLAQARLPSCNVARHVFLKLEWQHRSITDRLL